jgi:hypothetical protein
VHRTCNIPASSNRWAQGGGDGVHPGNVAVMPEESAGSGDAWKYLPRSGFVHAAGAESARTAQIDPRFGPWGLTPRGGEEHDTGGHT